MRRSYKVAAVMLAAATMPALAAPKIKGTTRLNNVQPANNPDTNKKNKQKQTYDLFFDAQGNSYTCRTPPNKSMNATDFVVGSAIDYEVDGQKAKIKTAAGKQVECSIVRVAVVGAPTTASSLPPS